MNMVTSARRMLVRTAKLSPFILCFLVLISYVENLYAIFTENYIVYDDYLIYNTPISFAIAMRMEYDVLLMILATIASMAIEACIYNLLATTYLWLNLYQRYALWEYGAFDDATYLVVIFINIIFLTWITYKGINQLN